MKVEFNISFVAEVKDSDDIEGIKNAVSDFIEQWGEVKTPISVTTPKKRRPIDKSRENELKEMFDDFWAAYPKKLDKQNAFKAFKKIDPDAELLARMLEAVEAFKKTEQWSDVNFIPYPSTWLNGRRYEDDLSTLNYKVKTACSQGREASYDLDKFKQESLFGDLKYKKRSAE